MKLIITFLFGLSAFVVSCGQVQPTPTAQAPTSTLPASKTPDTVTPTATVAPTKTLAPTPFHEIIDTPVPTVDILHEFWQENSEFIKTCESAIPYSYNMLVIHGDEDWFSYDNALCTPIEFPDGATGLFVAFGFSGTARSYKLLYQISDKNFRLIQLDKGGFDLGMTCGYALATPTTGCFPQKVDLSFPVLIRDNNEKNEKLIEISGVGSGGTGLITDGYFEILKITNDGFKVIFSGAKLVGNYNSGGLENKYQFDYVDLDGDGNKEIVKNGQECQVTKNTENKWVPINCETIHEIYKYNGDVYVKQP